MLWTMLQQVMQDTAHSDGFTSSLPQPKSMVERPSSSTASDAIEAVYGRQELMDSLPVEGFQCQLWEPSKAVLELEPGEKPKAQTQCSVIH